MITEFHILQLTRQEALECLRAQIHLAVAEEETRIQRGFESPELSPLILRLVEMLQLDNLEFDRMADEAAEDLWEYSWYAFTSEWAWFRARQEALRLLRKARGKEAAVQDPEYHKSAEKLYKKHFNRYVNELNMRHLSGSGATVPKNKKRSNGI
ncbi:MAG: hypothetical protein ACOYUZ_00370 [Patescibacteria group bacterium]